MADRLDVLTTALIAALLATVALPASWRLWGRNPRLTVLLWLTTTMVVLTLAWVLYW